MRPRKILIMGAAGRDFHNFNVRFRDDPETRVVAFTAAQIPYIGKRVYPASLAGKHYPKGIPIFPEEKLTQLITSLNVSEVVFAYSDVSNEYVMHKAAEVMAAGADFTLFGPGSTMISSKLPVISVCAVRTGAGKSPVTRRLLEILSGLGKRPVAIRHPMAYCDLERQRVQRFSTYKEIDTQSCTIEEKEEYEPIVEQGFTVFAGVDYTAVLDEAEKEADIIIWDGGNNDFPFIRPDMSIVVADAMRPGHELSYHPGETNFRMADVIIINKADRETAEGVKQIRQSAGMVNPDAVIITTESPVKIYQHTHGAPRSLVGRKVLVIEDGPTITHGGMAYGAGYAAARKARAEIVSPVPYAKGTLRDTLEKFPHIREVLPCMGYSPEQLDNLADTINSTPCDAVVFATPVNIIRLIKIDKPAYRVSYSVQEKGVKRLDPLVRDFLERVRK